MINIKYIKNIFEETDREFYALPYRFDWPVRKYLDAVSLDFKDMRVIVSGKCVYSKEKDIDLLDETIKPHDEIIVIPCVEGLEILVTTFGILAAVATGAAPIGLAAGSLAIAFGSFAATWGVLYGAILSIGAGIYSYFAKPSAPSFGGMGTGIEDASPTYSWNGVQTQMDVGVPVGIVYGEHKVGGNIINSYISTDGVKSEINILLALCEGEIESIDSVKINDNPYANFDNVTLYKRYGTNDQTVIPNFNDLNNFSALIGAALTKNNAYTYSGAITDLESVEFHLNFPQGLYQLKESDGSMMSWSATFTFEYRVHGVGSYIPLGTTTVSAKTRSPFTRIWRHDGLDADEYDFRITRTSDDSTTYKVGATTLQYVNEIQPDDLAYPNTALLGVKALATEQLSGVTPSVTSIVRGLKIKCPQVMNGGTPVSWETYYYDPDYDSGTGAYRLISDDTVLSWDGVTYHTAYCANPAWVIYDMITNNRYGIGEYLSVSNVNLANFVTESKYCETLVSDGDSGYEKRFRVDVVIDSPTRAIEAIHQICSSFRCLPFYSEGTVQIKIDRTGTADQIFNMSNIVEGTYARSWKGIKDTPNVIEVTFADKDKDYKQETISVADETALAAGDPVRKKQLRVYCTRMSQAIREGQYALNFATYAKRTVTFTAFIDAVTVQPGALIDIAHDVMSVNQSPSGRVQDASTTTLVKLDRSVTLAAGSTYEIMVRHADDTYETKTITSAAGTYTEVATNAFDSAPAEYDLWAIGKTDLVTKTYRVIACTRKNDFEVDIVGIEYNENVYDETGIIIPENNYEELTEDIPDVTDLELTEQATNGEVAIDVWFTKPDITDYQLKQYARAKIYLSDNGGDSYEAKGTTDGESFTIIGGLTTSTEYTVKVVSVTATGEEDSLSSAPSETITLTGSSSMPADVENFSYTFESLLTLEWDGNTEANLAGYEIVTGSQPFISGVPAWKGLATQIKLSPAARSGTEYRIKAYNSYGVYSSGYKSLTPENTAPSAPTLAGSTFFNVGRVQWSNLSDADLKYYSVYKSDTNAWTGEEEKVADVAGTSATLKGNKPQSGEVDTATSTSVTDADLAGLGVDALVGDKIIVTTGDAEGDERVISAYNNTTGEITVSSAFTATPAAGDFFFVFDTVHIKVCGVDTYGEGTKSAALSLTFEAITEDMLEDDIITARKIYVAQLSAITADLGTVTAGHLQGLTFSAGAAGTVTISGSSMVCKDNSDNEVFKVVLTGSDVGDVIFGDLSNGFFKWDASESKMIGDKIQSSNYVANTSGWKLDADTGLEVNEGELNNNVVTKSGYSSASGDTSHTISCKPGKLHIWGRGTWTAGVYGYGSIYLKVGTSTKQTITFAERNPSGETSTVPFSFMYSMDVSEQNYTPTIDFSLAGNATNMSASLISINTRDD